jgi:hypothetical protein
MSRPSLKSAQNAVARAVTPRLLVLELNVGRIHAMNTDGSNRKTIVSDCHLPDGIVVDAEAGHIYWTNMGIPNLNWREELTVTKVPSHRCGTALTLRTDRLEAPMHKIVA